MYEGKGLHGSVEIKRIYSIEGRMMAKTFIFKGQKCDLIMRFYDEAGGVDFALFDKNGEKLNKQRFLVDSSLEEPNIGLREIGRVLEQFGEQTNDY